MNIWLIQIGETLPIGSDDRKLRTAMLAEELCSRGHSVLWWASAFDHFSKKWVCDSDEDITLRDNYKIKLLKGIGYKKNISLKRFIDHRIISKKFRKFAQTMPRPDAIVAALPSYDLAYRSVEYAKRNKAPVLVDLRDQWPDIFIDQIPLSLRGVAKRILKNEYNMVRYAATNADGLISMMDSILEWGLAYAGRDRTVNDKVYYLGYKRDDDRDPYESEKISSISSALKSKFIVTFVGTFSEYHNPSILVDCARRFENTDVCFVLAGNGQYYDKVRERAKGAKNIIVAGWLNQREITQLLNLSNVGVCTTTRHAEFLPNKICSYLSAGLPVISGFQGEIRKIILSNGIGFNYTPNDVDELVGHLGKLYENGGLYKEMSDNALRTYDSIFNADRIYKDYADHIENIASTNGKCN